MKTMFGFGAVMAFAMAAVGCSSPEEEKAPPSNLEVTGRVDTRLRSLDNASAVAIGSNGRTISAYVKRDGSFKLRLPVGHTYRIVLANSTMGRELRTIGHLVNHTSDGKADEIAVKKGGRMNLGALRPAGTAASATAVKPKCGCDADLGGKGEPADDYGDKGDDDYGGKGETDGDYGDYGDYDNGDKDDPADDYKSMPKDDDKDRICGEEADVELEAEKEPGDRCKKGESDEPAPMPPKKSCSTKDDDKDGKDDPADADGKVIDKSGDSDDSSGKDPSGDKQPEPAPSKESGSSCSCSAQCGSGSSCYASKCEADDAPATK